MIYARILLVILLFSFQACSSQRMHEPEVSLVNVQFTGINLLSTEGVFTIRVDNENNHDLKVGSAVHRIYLNGDYVGKGFAKESLYLPALSSSTQRVKVSFNNIALVGRLRSLMQTEKLGYRVESRFYIDRGFGNSSISSTREGEIDLPGLKKGFPPIGPFR